MSKSSGSQLYIKIISILNIIGGGFKLESIIKLVPPALMLWCANNVKNQTNL